MDTCDKMRGKTLTLTVGLPRSGKSTWARRAGVPIVNPDSIRLALHGQRYAPAAEPMVWAIAKYMVHSLFLAGHDHVVVDATNTTEKRRRFWDSDLWAVDYVSIATSKEACIARARAENDLEIIPVIERMAEQFEPLAAQEGE